MSLTFFYRIMVGGCSGSGKTCWILECLKHREQLFTSKFDSITYFLPERSSYSKDSVIKDLKNKFPTIKIRMGLPSITEGFSDSLPKLWIIDDQMTEISNSKD